VVISDRFGTVPGAGRRSCRAQVADAAVMQREGTQSALVDEALRAVLVTDERGEEEGAHKQCAASTEQFDNARVVDELTGAVSSAGEASVRSRECMQGGGEKCEHKAVVVFLCDSTACSSAISSRGNTYASRGYLRRDSSSCKHCLQKKANHHGAELYCTAEADCLCACCNQKMAAHSKHGADWYCKSEAEWVCKMCGKTKALHSGAELYCPLDKEGASDFLRDLQALTQQRAVREIVLAMERHRVHRQVQEEACRVLVELTPSVEDEEWRRIWDEGGSALAGLRAEYAALAAHGVINAVSQAMATHACSASVVKSGCKVLGAMARNDDNKVKIAEAGGITAIVGGIRGNEGDARLQEEGCKALYNLAADADSKMKIAEAGGNKAIFGAMRRHEGDSQVQEEGRKALWSLKLRQSSGQSSQRSTTPTLLGDSILGSFSSACARSSNAFSRRFLSLTSCEGSLKEDSFRRATLGAQAGSPGSKLRLERKKALDLKRWKYLNELLDDLDLGMSGKEPDARQCELSLGRMQATG
jgi:hypothetical protein